MKTNKSSDAVVPRRYVVTMRLRMRTPEERAKGKAPAVIEETSRLV